MNTRQPRGRSTLLGVALVTIAGFTGLARAETPAFTAALERAAVAEKPLVLDFFTDW